MGNNAVTSITFARQIAYNWFLNIDGKYAALEGKITAFCEQHA